MEKAANIFRAEQSRAEQSRAEQSRAERLLTPFQTFYALFMWKIFRIRRAFFCAEVMPLKKSAVETRKHIPYIGNIE